MEESKVEQENQAADEVVHKSLYLALFAAQKEFTPIVKKNKAKIQTKTGGQFEYSFADLESVFNEVQPILYKHGLLLIHLPDMIEGKPVVRPRLIHAETGEYIEGAYPVVSADANDPQKVAGSYTMGKRYSSLSILGIPTTDDDGKSAAIKAMEKASPPPTVKQVQLKADPTAHCEIWGCKNPIYNKEQSKKMCQGHVICSVHFKEGNWANILANQEATDNEPA